LAVPGCAHLTSRKCCPTYVGHNHLLGSEAVRVLPCGPDGPFFGMKRTMWREWPVEWQLWQPASCPEMQPLEIVPNGGQTIPPTFEQPLAKPAPVYDMPQVPKPGGLEPQVPAPIQPRQSTPDDLFGPQDLQGPASPDTPAVPGVDQPTGSVEPSSWSHAQNDHPRSGSGDERRWDALLLRRLDSPSMETDDSVPLRSANTRAPRSSKLRR
jgi:hypothetical protein